MLLGNYSVYHKLPEKFLTGTTLYGDRANWNKPGMMRNMGVGSGNDWSLASVPHGLGMDGAWLLPQTAGGMTSRYAARVTITGTGVGARGSNIIASGLITITASGTGGLIAGAIGDATFTIDGSGSIRAIVGGIGAATITIDGTADIGAQGWLVGTGTMTVDATMDTYAIGWMVGTTEEAGLSVPGIARGVWAAIAADNDDTGTMGQKLNAAGTAGDPWTTVLPGDYAEGTAGMIVGTPDDPWITAVPGSYADGTAGKIIGTPRYQAKVWPLNHEGNDDYLMAWFKRGEPVVSGISNVRIRVVKAAEEVDLIPEDYATEVNTLGVFKYSTPIKMVSGQQYIIILGAYIDGEDHIWYQPYGMA